MINSNFKILNPVKIEGECRGYNRISFDSRDVAPHTLFVATVGTQVDGHNYIPKAVELGATVVVCETLPLTLAVDVCYVQVENSMTALAHLAAEYYGNPSKELGLVGVTGTNGKTTTATLLYDFFMLQGQKAGLLSTVVNRVGEREIKASHTTPDSLTINRLLREMVDEGCQWCFMEVSSHGVAQKRVEGLHFKGGVFTNLTHDHLDYHKTFAEYLKAKKGFFDALPSEAFALVNTDDRNGMVMLQNSKARKCDYALLRPANYKCKIIEEHLDGMLLEINNQQLWTQFIGRFNAYNLSAIYATVLELGVEADEALRVLSLLRPVAGRFQTIRSDSGVLGIVDYAHTPDALSNVIETINKLKGGGKLITVVGCGGDRDSSKRPVMARIAVEGSERVILTSDNPRSEEPRAILDDMLAGVEAHQRARVLVIEDRAEAIRASLAFAASGDIVLVAGKGHENYQEIKGVRHHFDDMEQLENLM